MKIFLIKNITKKRTVRTIGKAPSPNIESSNSMVIPFSSNVSEPKIIQQFVLNIKDPVKFL